jgi:hypothetical protein
MKNVMTFEQYCANFDEQNEGLGDIYNKGKDIVKRVAKYATEPNLGYVTANIEQNIRSYAKQGIIKEFPDTEPQNWVNAFNAAVDVNWDVDQIKNPLHKSIIEYLLKRGEWSAGSTWSGATGANIKKASSFEKGKKYLTIEDLL